MGFSVVKIAGSDLAVQLAQQRIQASLSLVAPAGADGLPVPESEAGGESEMQVEQRWVGWLLGKGGVVLKEMELQSGAVVKIDQSTKDQGYSTVRIAGDWQQTATARQ